MSRKLSTHFSLDEAVVSATALKLHLDNVPPVEVVTTMMQTANYMEAVRKVLKDNPITVFSWYRSPRVNFACGSHANSQHIKGEAVDFACSSFGTILQVCQEIIAHKDIVKFDQMILEHSWVHISFAILSGKPRGQVLSLVTGNRYVSGLTDSRGVPY